MCVTIFVLVRVDPQSGNLQMISSYYYKGDCNDQDVQGELKDRYVNIISNPQKFPAPFCLLNQHCKVENVQVFCGPVDASRRRRRRRGTTEMEVNVSQKVFSSF